MSAHNKGTAIWFQRYTLANVVRSWKNEPDSKTFVISAKITMSKNRLQMAFAIL